MNHRRISQLKLHQPIIVKPLLQSGHTALRGGVFCREFPYPYGLILSLLRPEGIFYSASHSTRTFHKKFPLKSIHFVDKAEGVTYARQWFVHHDIPQPEMARVGVQVSWRGALPEVALWPADRAVMASAKAPWPVALTPKVVLWPKGSPSAWPGSSPVWSEQPPES